jgi:hypothetical protein
MRRRAGSCGSASISRVKVRHCENFDSRLGRRKRDTISKQTKASFLREFGSYRLVNAIEPFFSLSSTRFSLACEGGGLL